MRTAIDTGLVDPQVVLIDARRRTGAQHPGAAVIPLGGVAHPARPPPTLAAYDQLLTGSEG